LFSQVFASLGQEVAALAGLGVEQHLDEVVQLFARDGALAQPVERRGRVLVRRLADGEHRQRRQRGEREGDHMAAKTRKETHRPAVPLNLHHRGQPAPPGGADAMIRIAIIDDHAIVRAGLRQYFSEQVDLQVVAEASNGREAVDIVRKGQVDVLVMDLSMPDQSGVDALAAIKARAPDLPVLILSGFPEEHYATTLLRQGASGYLNKDCDPEEIVKAIRTVYRGRKYITAGVAELLADGLGGGGDKPPHEQLSEREFQVFLRLAKGETIGHMANSMSLSVKTVSTYRTRVMEKMKLESNSDLTYYALKNGLIQ
jgi:two-component system invasion response regulator UvrY